MSPIQPEKKDLGPSSSAAGSRFARVGSVSAEEVHQILAGGRLERLGVDPTSRFDGLANLIQIDRAITTAREMALLTGPSCWIARAGQYWYISNAGSGTLSGFSAGRHGALTDLGNTSTDLSTVDAAASPDGRFLYVQTGLNGTLNSFQVSSDGSLTAINSPITVESPRVSCSAYPVVSAMGKRDRIRGVD